MMTMSLMIMMTMRVVVIAPLFSMKPLLTGLSASFCFLFFTMCSWLLLGFLPLSHNVSSECCY